MPIRFRCSNCNQLMGISRRKAGALVRCPACRVEIPVPDTDEQTPTPVHREPPALVPPLPRAGFFDRDDFDALLEGSTSMAGARPAPPLAVPPHLLPAPAEARAGNLGAEPAAVRSAPTPNGIVLSPGWATMLTVVFLLLLALAFALGLLVGRHALTPAEPNSTSLRLRLAAFLPLELPHAREARGDHAEFPRFHPERVEFTRLRRRL